jgi:hypothetical protein
VGRSRVKIFLQARKSFSLDFRKDAQPHGLTRGKIPRTLRAEFRAGNNTSRKKFSLHKNLRLFREEVRGINSEEKAKH